MIWNSEMTKLPCLCILQRRSPENYSNTLISQVQQPSSQDLVHIILLWWIEFSRNPKEIALL